MFQKLTQSQKGFKIWPILILIVSGLILLMFSYVTYAQITPTLKKGDKKPNIIWITCEDMSLHLSCFGEKLIKTPNLDALAKDAVRYTNVYTVAGVCAPSRNGIITGMHPISIGGDNMRNYQPGKKTDGINKTNTNNSYSIVPPEYVKCFPEYLRSEGYYCTNNPKEDYQFETPVTVWDESNGKAHWKNHPSEKPFFAIFNLEVTHESQLWKRDSFPLLISPDSVDVPDYYPDVPEIRRDIARQLSNVIEMDKQAGKLLQELKEAGLYDNTYIFFFSDHGDGLPYVKREITTRGLHIPLIVKFPYQELKGTTENRMISSIDLAPTVLQIAGIKIPSYMHGKSFLGAGGKTEQKYIFAARDRMDEKVDRVRTVFDGRFQYIRNYIPGLPYYQDISYRMQLAGMRKIITLRDSGKLNEIQLRWFKLKPAEELYDTKNDPNEINNLIEDPSLQTKLSELKEVFNNWISSVGDLHALNEADLKKKMWNSENVAPKTAVPEIINNDKGYMITCNTKGASIGYLILGESMNVQKQKSYHVYNGETIALNKGEKLIVRAQRIGYDAAEITFDPFK